MVGAATALSSINTTYLVEEGPQFVSKRIPEQLERLDNGTPRMGYQSLPSDYAYQEYVQALASRAIAGELSLLGQEVDILG